MVNGAFLNKREIGRPVKYNIRGKGRQGWLELVFNPRNNFEKYVSNTLRFIHPYLAFVTYRFHVEKSREIGIRVEDFYCNKFHKEPYIQHHIFAQYFHPDSLLERVRDVRFYRNPRTLFKGFKVPDWATAEKRHGWELDAYSRQAWENAMHDLNSEWTPMQFTGERLEPNILNWFRLEQWGKGNSSRLFYNEVPKPTWFRYGGHLDNPEKTLHSFTNADQEHKFVFGIDTTTPEGREQFKKEWETACQLVPELISKEDMVYPHEAQPLLSEEPHFRRVWQHYREHLFKLRFAYLVQEGKISESDAASFRNYVDFNGGASFTTYLYSQLGLIQKGEDFEAAQRVLEALGLSKVEISRKTAQSYEEQFWDQFDVIFELSEEGLQREIPAFITDPSNKAKVEALISGRKYGAVPETTQKLEISA